MCGSRTLVLVAALCVPVIGCNPNRRMESDAAARRQRDSIARRLGAAPPAATLPQVPPLDPIDAQRLTAAADRAARSIVHVETTLPANAEAPRETPRADSPRLTHRRSGGTGVIIAADGLVLTNEHVVRHAERIVVHHADGRCLAVRHVVTADDLDLAILVVDAEALPPLPLEPTATVAGAAVTAIARPCGCCGPTTRSGRVICRDVSLQSQLDPRCVRDYAHLIESSTALTPGFSGSPLLDSEGRCVGVNVAAIDAHAAPRGYALAFDDHALARVAGLIARVRAAPLTRSGS